MRAPRALATVRVKRKGCDDPRSRSVFKTQATTVYHTLQLVLLPSTKNIKKIFLGNIQGRLTEVRNRNYHPDSDAMKTAEKRFNTAQDDFQQADAERAEASEAYETVKRLLDSCEAFIAQHELTPREAA